MAAEGRAFNCLVSFWVLLLPRQQAATSALSLKPSHIRSCSQADDFSSRLDALSAARGAVVIDVDNVRGKGGFELSQEQLMSKLARWARAEALRGHVVMVIDHGAREQAVYMRSLGIAVAFAGSEQSADDVIARDLPSLAPRVLLITADAELVQRCRRGAGRASVQLQVASPLRLLEALSSSASAQLSSGASAAPCVKLASRAAVPDLLPWMEEAHIQGVEDEMAARAALIRAQRLSAKIRGGAAKQRRLGRSLPLLTDAVASRREQLEQLRVPSIDRILADAELNITDGAAACEAHRWTPKQLEALLKLLVSRQRARATRAAGRALARRDRYLGRAPQTEHTYHRMCSAELLRRRLQCKAARLGDGSARSVPAYEYVQRMRCRVSEKKALAGRELAVVDNGRLSAPARSPVDLNDAARTHLASAPPRSLKTMRGAFEFEPCGAAPSGRRRARRVRGKQSKRC